MLNSLREATAVLHEQLEEENTASLIMDHSISLSQYKELLYQNYIAYAIAEKEIGKHLPDYQATKHKALSQDLEALNVLAKVPQSLDKSFSCNSRVEALGAAYVVEGSVMGGMLIAKNVKECPNLSTIETHHFFSGKRDGIKTWREFTKTLKETNFTEEEIRTAQEKAKQTFILFSEAFKIQITGN